MTRPALVANLLTLLAFPIPSAAAPAVPAAVPGPAEVTPISAPAASAGGSSSDAGLMGVQLLAGYLIGIGGTIVLIDAGVHPDSSSELVNFGYVGVLASTLTTAAVCGPGYLSSRYQGRCATTLLGALAGAALGVVIGAMVAPETSREGDIPPNVIAALVGGALLMPVGAVAGWELGKREIARPAMVTAQPSRNLMLPVLSLRW